MRSRPFPEPLLVAAALLAAVPVLWACAPYLPNWLLGSEGVLFEGFTGRLAVELDRLQLSQGRPQLRAAPAENEDFESEILAAERAELAQALEIHGTWPMLRAKVVENVVRLREDLVRAEVAREEYLSSGTKPGRLTPSGLAVPKPLLPEFSDYLEGAIAYHEGRSGDAAAAWERLLRRPAHERRFRSTWAAYMLGKLRLHGDPDRAVKSFQLTRELAAGGFRDSLGLAASSLGWEAYAELARDGYDRALVLYAQQARTGDPTALPSLRLTCAELLDKGPEALAAVAKNPAARAVFTAWIVSHNPDGSRAWEQALKAADVRDAAGADRLAWAAYLDGDFAGAEAWLDRAQPPSPIAKWVRARLLLRAGRLDEARDLLAEVSGELPDLGIDMQEAMEIVYQTSEILAAPQRALGEEAVVRVARQDYTGALDRFLRAGYWMDAAYLAEQVLTAGELKAYVDATWPADLAAKYEPPSGDEWEPLLVGGYTTPAPERLAREVRYLLGRRLAREGRLRDAAIYVLPEHRPALERLAGHVEAGRDRKRPAAERGRQLFQAACLTRRQGMELTGTEVEPDWTLVEGAYEVEQLTFGTREKRRENLLLRELPEETVRVERNRVRPWKRFHYRYRAADLAWEAAALLPSGDEKAGMLATAGSWIEHSDPQAADRFYKQLVRCCGSTELGRQADELRWFPEADACPASGEGSPDAH